MEPVDTGRFFEGVDCPHCGTVLIRGFDDRDENEGFDSPACEHVFVMAHDLGITYLSPEAMQEIKSAGLVVDMSEAPLLHIQAVTDDEDEADSWAVLGRAIRWPEAQILATYAPAPSFDGTYVGVAPMPR